MPGPLRSLRVLDFTTLLPGPYATLLLADLGADVVRIESPDRPDLMRLAPPYDDTGTPAGYAWVHRSKRSVVLDLKHPQATSVVRRLVHHYDIVVEGFRPGVMHRLGLDYETLAAENPALIYCAVTGYGQTGPYRERAGHDLNYQSLSGLLSHSGRREVGPVPSGVPLADVAGGLFAALAILAAVVHRQRTGEGQYLDLALLDTTIAFNGLAVSGLLGAGHRPGYETEPLNGGSFYDCYRTRDGRYLAVAGLEPKFWEGFCEAIGRPDLAPYGYNVWDAAVQQRLKKEIQQVIASRTLAEWQAVFAERDVCVEPVLTLEEMAQHPQVRARGLIVEVPRPDATPQRQVGFPVQFSRTPPSYRHTGPPLGTHTREVLQEAGFTSEEIEALATEGAFGADFFNSDWKNLSPNPKAAMPKYTSIPEVLESYKERFLPDQAAGVEGVVQLNLTGEGGGEYYMVIKDGTLEIKEGKHENPTVTVTTSAENWLKINNGEANPMSLMMMGKLKVSGSLPMAMKFQSLFRMG